MAVRRRWMCEGRAGYLVEVGLLEMRLLEAEVADRERRDAGDVCGLAERGKSRGVRWVKEERTARIGGGEVGVLHCHRFGNKFLWVATTTLQLSSL